MRKTSLTLIALAAFACMTPVQAQVLGGRGDLSGGLSGAIDRTGGMLGGNLSGNGRIDGRLPAAGAIDRLEAARERAARRARANGNAIAGAATDAASRGKRAVDADASRASSQGERGTALAGTLSGAAQAALSGNDTSLPPAATTTQPPASALDVAGSGEGAASAVLGRGAQEDASDAPGTSGDTPARRPLLPSADAEGSADGSASASASRESGASASTSGSARGSAQASRGKAHGSDSRALAVTPGSTSAPAPATEPRPAAKPSRDRKQVDDPR